MRVTEALNAMRSEIPGCSLVAYADLSTQLVLSASAATKPGQERLDALSSAAVLALKGALADGAAALWDEPSSGADKAMLLTNAEARVFLKSPGAASEALICVCPADADLDKVVDCGQETLARILSQSEG